MTAINESNSGFTESYDNINYTYTARFTIPSDCRSYTNTAFYLGDRNEQCSGYNAYFTDITLKKVSTDTVTNFPEIVSGNTTSASLSANSKYRIASSHTSKVLIESIGNTFDPYVEPVHDYVHFEPNRNDCSRFLYSVGYKTLPAGDYRFQMDCKIFSGTPKIAVGNRDDGNTAPLFGDGLQTNYNASYDAENNKYTITFTLPSGLTGSYCIGVLVGNYGTTGDFVCAEPTLYHLDGSGEPTGDNLVKPFSSDYYSTSAKSGYWYRAGNYTCRELPDNYFDKDSTSNFVAYFPQVSDSYQVIVYKDTGIYVAANSVYRLVMDVNNLTAAEPTVQMRTGSDIGTSYTGTLISTNGFERVYEFTVGTAATGIGLFMGPYGNGSNIDVAFRKMRLYKYENDAYAGSNMLAAFNANNFDRHDWTGSRANALNGKWTPLNCNGTLFEYGVDDKSHFPVEKMVHFPIGYDNYHVLAYKGGEIAAGTYRFTMDECALGGIKSYVNLFVNSGYTTAVTKVDGSDILDQTNRTVEFELYNPKDSFLLMVGNYGKGNAMESYMKNAALYKIEGGVAVGENLITTFMNYNLSFVTDGSRANAKSGKWTSINWADGYINAGDIDEDCFIPAYLGGDYNNDGVADVKDLVIYKNVRIHNSVTCLSLDCDNNGVVDGNDHTSLIKTIIGLYAS